MSISVLASWRRERPVLAVLDPRQRSTPAVVRPVSCETLPRDCWIAKSLNQARNNKRYRVRQYPLAVGRIGDYGRQGCPECAPVAFSALATILLRRPPRRVRSVIGRPARSPSPL